AIADHGFQVDLIEKEENLGGNLLWLRHTLGGNPTQEFLDEMVQKTERHPKIEIHTQSRVVNSLGRIGEFYTTVENQQGDMKTIEHGVIILSTGGTEASTDAYGYGSNESIITQKELEIKLTDQTIDPAQLNSVVMIQCVGSREEPRNYCSRVCCNSALKHALNLKEKKPDLPIYILYRDMMSYGFNETYFTQARRAGVFFIQYNPENKPEVESADGSIKVKLNEPILQKQVEIDTDLLVLATGVNPNLPPDLTNAMGVHRDEFGFFKEAESKWRPVDSLKDGIFACGLAHSPRSINETVATAEAAAQRALRVIVQKSLPSGKVVAKVRHSICSLCELCIDTCPYEARFLDEETGQVQVNSLMCQGCGSCAAVCPNGATILEGYSRKQILQSIDAVFV
ncbi:MAG: 4Fe-4S dicluster domain-containing protein, partial [Deltaproteobacteria bacterium]|nr:4Fe-4S dicluster domain-containing protein [Deltaproteobacteria bacterium]